MYLKLSNSLVKKNLAKVIPSYGDKNNIYIETGNILDDLNFYESYAKKSDFKILEIGCGYGRILLELNKNNYDISGMDISKDLLDIIKTKNPNIKLYNMDMRNFYID